MDALNKDYLKKLDNLKNEYQEKINTLDKTLYKDYQDAYADYRTKYTKDSFLEFWL